jgi:hypothetical protein
LPKYPTSRRLVLKGCPARDQAENVAAERGWVKFSEIAPDADGVGLFEMQYRVWPGLAFFYVENDLSGDCSVGFIVTDVLSEVDPDEQLSDLESSFDTWSVDELLDAVDRAGSPVDYARAVLRAAIGAPVEFDERFFERIARAATSRLHGPRCGDSGDDVSGLAAVQRNPGAR